MSEAEQNRPLVDLLISPIGELATPEVDHGPARGSQMREIRRIRDAAIAVSRGKIVYADRADRAEDAVDASRATVIADAANRLVTPGLIDPHTHLIFAGNRAGEFVMRCQGKTYMEIARAGGGIVSSMNATRTASVAELVALAKPRLRRMAEYGTTTVEVKTGYGLSEESELTMLEAILELSRAQPLELAPTFMPAHAYPPGVAKSAYVDSIINRMLPAVVAMYESRCPGKPLPFNDVFCDEGYFSLEETRRILEAGLRLGFGAKIHADEFVNLGGTGLAVDLKALSADHLLNVSTSEIDRLAGSETVAVLLPGTSFYLNLPEHAPATKMIEHGVAVALGSDFNPGSCHIFSLPFIWALACLQLRMLPEEALSALTVNAAFAIGHGGRLGQLRPGYQADIVIFDLSTLEEVPYNLGGNPVLMTFKNGVQISNRTPACC